MSAAQGIYLDNNATTFLLPEVATYMTELIERPIANPSSAHQLGREAKATLEQARLDVATAIGANLEQVYFVSSGSEANTLALHSVLRAEDGRDTIVTTTIEHSSIQKAAMLLCRRGFRVVEVEVTRDGLIDMDRLKDVVGPRTALVSVQWVNNETGVVQPLGKIRDIVRGNGALLHCDAAQALGKLPIDVDECGVDLLTITAHKINGPQGSGALFARSRTSLTAVIGGGTQEHGLRGGTENLLGIAGFGLAARVRSVQLPAARRNMEACRDAFEGGLVGHLPGVAVNGDRSNRVCNTSNLRFDGVDGRMLVAQLDKDGIYCSQSSACTSQTSHPSHVLLSMGLDEAQAYSSIRFSFGVTNTVSEALAAAEKVTALYKKMRELALRFG